MKTWRIQTGMTSHWTSQGTQGVSMTPMGFELVQSDAETGLIESEGGPNSASTQHTSASRRTRTAAKSSELLRPLFHKIFADEVAPPVGPLVVVASLRKTGKSSKKKASSPGP